MSNKQESENVYPNREGLIKFLNATQLKKRSKANFVWNFSTSDEVALVTTGITYGSKLQTILRTYGYYLHSIFPRTGTSGYTIHFKPIGKEI